MMNDEGQESKIINNFARIDFCSKYKSFALLKLQSTRTFVLLPLLNPIQHGGEGGIYAPSLKINSRVLTTKGSESEKNSDLPRNEMWVLEPSSQLILQNVVISMLSHNSFTLFCNIMTWMVFLTWFCLNYWTKTLKF